MHLEVKYAPMSITLPDGEGSSNGRRDVADRKVDVWRRGELAAILRGWIAPRERRPR